MCVYTTIIYFQTFVRSDAIW